MRDYLNGIIALAIGGLLSVAVVGCGARQDTGEQTEPTPPPAATDYWSRMDAALQAEGIDLDEIACNTDVVWADRLGDDADAFYSDIEASISPHLKRLREPERQALAEQVSDLAMNWFIRVLLIHGDFNNVGAVVIPTITWGEGDEHHPLIVFHSGTTPFAEDEGSCFRSLVRQGHIRHVVNLYDGDVPLRDQIEAESRVAAQLGADYIDLSQVDHTYGNWREIAGDAAATEEQRQAAMQGIARLIREQILRPAGAPPRGNIYFHCAGGMHRSPLLAGVLRKCLAGDSIEQVREAMQAHTDYIDESHAGGYEAPILEIVRSFDCSLLEVSSGGAAPAGDAGAGGDAAAGEGADAGGGAADGGP